MRERETERGGEEGERERKGQTAAAMNIRVLGNVNNRLSRAPDLMRMSSHERVEYESLYLPFVVSVDVLTGLFP